MVSSDQCGVVFGKLDKALVKFLQALRIALGLYRNAVVGKTTHYLNAMRKRSHELEVTVGIERGILIAPDIDTPSKMTAI